ncbi:MAG: type I 3-dehydroquinate dehydratase, partial [Planctomycetota bacterium]
IATVRRREEGGRWTKSEGERLMLLRGAIASGAFDYVDLESDIADQIPRYGQTKRIVSFHLFEGTPDDLEGLHQAIAAEDADIIKIATMANSIDDCFRMMEVVKNAKVPTIGICMGEMGTMTRILSTRLGSPFTYASFSVEKKVAPGLIHWLKMRDLYRIDDISPQTELFGVIADPVAHSHSPIIHNGAFQAAGIDARYLPFRVPQDDLQRFIQGCSDLGVHGLSVTIPHKEEALDECSQAEQAATGIGAVNTIVFDKKQTLGYNTDYRAAMDCIESVFQSRQPSSAGMEEYDARGMDRTADEPLRGFRCLLMGAGGVSRAIAWGLIQRGMSVVLTSRTQTRADRLAQDLGCRAVPWEHRKEVRFDLLVNGTPVGMFPNVDATPFPSEAIMDDQVVFDTVYNPEQTLLIKDARRARASVITGVDMFIRQAAYQYKLFTGRDADIELMRTKLKEATSPVRLNRDN